MTKPRLALITGALVASVLLVQSVILTLYGAGFEVASYAALGGSSHTSGLSEIQPLFPFLPGILVRDFFVAAAFGAGVFLALRFIRPIESGLTWQRVILRGVVAAAIGTVGIFAVTLLQTLLTNFSIGPYPLGYSFTPSVDPGNLSLGLLNAFSQLLNPFVNYAPLVVLACVFLKLWLTAHPTAVQSADPTEPKDRASASV